MLGEKEDIRVHIHEMFRGLVEYGKHIVENLPYIRNVMERNNLSYILIGRREHIQLMESCRWETCRVITDYDFSFQHIRFKVDTNQETCLLGVVEL